MSARQLIALAVAAIAAIGAMLIFRNMGGQAAPSPAAAADIPGVRVLVATKDIAQGAGLTSGDVQWRVFPQESLSVNFIQEAQRPNAPSDMSGWVVRRAYVEGEPIITGSILDPEGRGFMAAVLEPGYRAVSIKVNDETSAGQFVQPNDRVDVLLTVEVESGGGASQDKEVRTSIVLENVRVLAIGENVVPQASGASPERATGDVAVLELTQGDARLVAQAEALGDLRLALRGVAIEPPGLIVESSAVRGAAALGQNVQSGVRVHAFGAVSDTRGGT